LSLHLHDGGREGARTWIHPRASGASRSLAHEIQRALDAFGPAHDVLQHDLGVLTPERLAPGAAACFLEIAGLARPAVRRRFRAPRNLDDVADAIAEAVGRFDGGGALSSAQQTTARPLAFGQVVRVEARTPNVEPMTHEYPIDVRGNVKLPLLGLVRANG